MAAALLLPQPHPGVKAKGGVGDMDAELLEARRDQARSNPLRLKVLALAVKRGQSLDPDDLRRELAERPSVALIEYHLRVLREVGLLLANPPGTKPTRAQLDEWLDRR